MKIDIEGFGSRLTKCMETLNLSNSYITKELNLSKNAIGNYKNNQIPNATILFELSQILGTTIEWLLTGETLEVSTYKTDEQLLIENYRKCTNSNKEQLLKLSQTLGSIFTEEAAAYEGKSSDYKIG